MTDRIDSAGLVKVTHVVIDPAIAEKFAETMATASNPIAYHDDHLWAKDYSRTVELWSAWYPAWYAGRQAQRIDDMKWREDSLKALEG